MSISISEALNIIKASRLVAEKVTQNPTNRVDESMIYDTSLCSAMTDIAKTIYPETIRVTFSRNHPVILTNHGWKAGKNVDRRGLVDKFNAQELTEDEIKEILRDCINSQMLTTENTPQFDWDGYFSKYVKNLGDRSREEWIARWGINGDLPTVARDPVETAKKQRLRATKRAKEYHDAVAEKGDMIPFSIDAVTDMLIKIGAIAKDSRGFYLPGTPYIVPNKGIIRLRLTRKDGTESNRIYKTTKIDVFRDPTHPKGRFGATPFRWEPISGYLCSKADLEAACQELKSKDWEDIKGE